MTMVRIGRRITTPAANYDELVGRGRYVTASEAQLAESWELPPCKQCAATPEGYHPHCDPIACPDCGLGEVMWAEAGFVPWHRACNRCGAHFEQRSATRLRRARFEACR